MISPRHNLLRCSSVVILVVSFGVGISGCAQGPDDLIDDLSGTVEEREAATQELLLAKERAVEPLLQALADHSVAEARAALVEILISLMMRVDDERIGSALHSSAGAGLRCHPARPAHPARRHASTDPASRRRDHGTWRH